MSTIKTPIQKILLLDDDREDCEIFKEALKEIDPSLQLYCLYEGEGLLKAIESQQPDIIFLDMHMPKMGGIDCLRMLHKEGICNRIPVILYSGSESQRDIDLAYQLGAAHYFRKQFHLADMIQHIQEIVYPSKRA
jgi:CheY-like chemotaxis protein